MTPYLGSPRQNTNDFTHYLTLVEKQPQTPQMNIVREEELYMDSSRKSISSSS